MSARDAILGRVRSALTTEYTPPAPPRLSRLRLSLAEKIVLFFSNLGKLSGKTFLAGSQEQARLYVEAVVSGRSWMASTSPFLIECGIVPAARVATETVATVEIGITSADYALADPGTLVMISEPRLLSLLPPVHIAVIPRHCLLTNLDELLELMPLPVEQSSSTVLITGPSRTGDIEQILVKGVHGPGEIHVVVV